jgi:type VI protein secretion system component VasK
MSDLRDDKIVQAIGKALTGFNGMFGMGNRHVEQVEMTMPASEPVNDADTAIFAQALENLKLEMGDAKPKVKAKKRYFFT